jgi:hypothetical protein
MSSIKSKEDILNEKDLIFYMANGIDEVEGKKQDVLECMDKWAEIKSRQVAIEFRKWCRERNKLLLYDEAGQWPLGGETDEQLYELFQKSKQQ